MSFHTLPSSVTLEILDYVGKDDIETLSNLSISSKKINNYFKSEPTILIKIIKYLVRELHIYKYISKTYETLTNNISNSNMHTTY